MPQFASPTFLFRKQCPATLQSIMFRLAECGFDGLELYGMFGFDSTAISGFCQDSGLTVLCDHVHYAEFTENTRVVIKTRVETGARYLTVDNLPEECLPGQPGFSQAIWEIERLGRCCRDSGLQLLYHNHGYDLIRKVDGIPMLDLLLDHLDPELVKFQPDLGWIRLGGGDPAAYLEKYRSRCPVIHLKDYFAVRPILLESPFLLGDKRGGEAHGFFEFRPCGFGVMNFPELMPQILACAPEWITIDHDMSYERDTFADMEMSLQYIRNLMALYT